MSTNEGSKREFEVRTNDPKVVSPASKDRVDKLEEKIYETRDQVMANYISVLGIFASIVTFLLIEIQLLRHVCDFYRLMGFSFFIVGLLLTFTTALNFLITSRKEQSFVSVILIILVIFIVFIFGFFILREAEDEYTCRITNVENRFEILRKDLLDSCTRKCEELNTESGKLQKERTINELE